MSITEEDINRRHMYHIARKYCANVEMGDIIILHGAAIHHKTSRTMGLGDRHYTYVVKHEEGWRIYIKIKANNELFSARITRRHPDTDDVYDAVNEWMAEVCA